MGYRRRFLSTPQRAGSAMRMPSEEDAALASRQCNSVALPRCCRTGDTPVPPGPVNPISSGVSADVADFADDVGRRANRRTSMNVICSGICGHLRHLRIMIRKLTASRATPPLLDKDDKIVSMDRLVIRAAPE